MSEAAETSHSHAHAVARAIEAFRTHDGLEALRMMARGELPPPNVARWLGMSLDVVEPGRVVFSMEPRVEHYNLIGSVHGGIVTTIMDSALGCAAQSLLLAGEVATTMDLHTRFHRPVTIDVGRVLAEATIVHKGRRTITAEARLIDTDGRLYATGASTLMVLGEV